MDIAGVVLWKALAQRLVIFWDDQSPGLAAAATVATELSRGMNCRFIPGVAVPESVAAAAQYEIISQSQIEMELKQCAANGFRGFELLTAMVREEQGVQPKCSACSGDLASSEVTLD